MTMLEVIPQEFFNPRVGQTRTVTGYDYSVDDGLSIELQLNDFIDIERKGGNRTVSAAEKRAERVRGAEGQPLVFPRLERIG